MMAFPTAKAAATMAVAFWPVSLSRQALRGVTLIAVWLPASLRQHTRARSGLLLAVFAVALLGYFAGIALYLVL